MSKTSVIVGLILTPIFADIKLVPDEYSTIQSAIDAAATGDTVLVKPGTYLENINFNGKNITVGSLYVTTDSLIYRLSTIIDGGGTGSVVKFENSEDSSAVLSGMTLTNGQSTHGGGIYVLNSSPTLIHLLIIENSAAIGGAGIFVKNSAPRLSAVDIVKNTSFRGSGIHFDASTASFDSVNRSNIHSNIGTATGAELFGFNSPSLNVYLDTFTVFYPIETQVFPRDEFNLDILYAKNSSTSPFLEQIGRIYAEGTDDGRNARVDTLVKHARVSGVPVIEDSTVYFFYLSASSPVKYSSVGGFGNEQVMTKVGTTNLFYLPLTFEMDARGDYEYIVDGKFNPDPENPHISYVFGINDPLSEIAMPNYLQPQEVLYDSSIPHGTIENHTIESADLGFIFPIHVYLPPDYAADQNRSYPTLYFNDGQLMESVAGGPLQNILDYMTHQGTIDGMIAVFIGTHPTVRGNHYATTDRLKYQKFVSVDLVNFIDSNFRTIPHWAARAIAGASSGGLISTQIAYNSGKFGLLAAYSPSYLENSKTVYNSVLSGPVRNLRIYIEWGTYEGRIQSDGILFKDGIIARGYDVEWNAWHEGHSFWNWRAHIDNAIEFLFPPGFLHTVHTGDTDNNGVVNELDVLPIALYFLEQGYQRHPASYTWNDAGEYNWAWTQAGATYADANGDGVVDERDVIAVGINWGNSHNAAKSLSPIVRDELLLTTELRTNFETIYKSIKGMGEPAVKMRTLLRSILKLSVPDAYALQQNFPNPFNPTTTIRFGLPIDDIVTLTIYNLRGQTIAVPLDNIALNAGSHEIVYDASQLGSGIYFYRLTSGSWSATRKMVIIK